MLEIKFSQRYRVDDYIKQVDGRLASMDTTADFNSPENKKSFRCFCFYWVLFCFVFRLVMLFCFFFVFCFLRWGSSAK